MSIKRKATYPLLGGEQPDPKRRKLPGDDAITETPEVTTTIGLGFIQQLRDARDKRGRYIAQNFLTLPDPKDLPGYYQHITLPIAVDTIEAKLQRHEYPNVSAVESDLKRMIANAKSFNEKTSEIHSDAEKIRKMVSHHMQKLNPAYMDKDYAPIATPLPGEEGYGSPPLVSRRVETDGPDDEDEVKEEAPAEQAERPRRAVILHGPKDPAQRASQTPTIQPAADAGESFVGNSFQQAQEKIVTEMMDHTNEDGANIAGPFVNLPPRHLKDYYQLIKHPVGVKAIQKSVQGIKGRDKPTGISHFKSWQQFEDEASYIWRNAREYNEDGSDIYKQASELERWFQQRLGEAKAVVPEPAQSRVKLTMSTKAPEPSKITLHVGPRPSPGGVSVDAEALKRQREMVQAGANGIAALTSAASSVGALPQSATTPMVLSNGAASQLSPPMGNGVKHESKASTSPAPSVIAQGNSVNGTVTAPRTSMPPPAMAPPLPSGSPYPQAGFQTTYHQSMNPIDSRFRLAGKTATDALIPNLNVRTHPLAPNIPKNTHFNLDIPASETLTQQSVTFSLPSTHSILRITPTLAATTSQRQTKVIVSTNGTKSNPVHMRAEDTDPRRPQHDVRIMPGILNRIEVEMIAGPARGTPKIGTGMDIELERITMFVNMFPA